MKNLVIFMTLNIDIGLTEEQTKELEAYIKKNYVMRVFYEKTTTEKDLELETLKQQQLSLEKKLKDYDRVEKELVETKKSLDQSKIDHENAILKIKMDYAIKERLKSEGARNMKAIEPFLDYSSIQLDEKDGVLGLENQIKNLKASEETKFLFYEKSTKGNPIDQKNEYKTPEVTPSKTSYSSFTDSLNNYARSLHSPQS